MLFDGIEIDHAQLYTRQEVLDILRESGATDGDLSKIRENYEEKFGNDLIWRYPIMVGEALGTVIIPVKEGFLSIAYDSMDPEDYEIYDLKNEFLLSSYEIKLMMDSWLEYLKGLMNALQSMQDILYKEEKKAD
ncbi:MAG: hypothetical protein LBI03_01370 [Clostridiales bacterium]|jgi:hypothetical protein|nr:hypothetical protein [Clostridiales bacterium]